MKGKTHSVDTKRKIGLASLGRVLSEESRKKISNAQKGKKDGPMSEETKRKISDSNKGKKRTEETKLRMSIGHKGQIYTEEMKIRASISKKGKPNYKNRGVNAPNWQGGITGENKIMRRSIEFREWREKVFARDNWTCNKCKIRGLELHPHHVNNFAQHKDIRFDVSNGSTLCKPCHTVFHKTYGYKNNTQEQLNEFLTKQYE